ncbi:GAF domain-containing sensor histidine kinase [Pedobacter mendelii]|uniref:histidine kinase n=1 Tax=Pedobacter mendelii TaxID=1908240 RepID=A0ABQ2BH66_9SPHI|nr:GAF domain-containing sensor histidine kinase [Pedobacter mendelii]GGI24565.1 sensor histidine kinase [Pedobacter mendelii]
MNHRSSQTPLNIKADIEAISNIPAVANILQVICRTTGMGFAAVARVTDDKWVACALLDHINFGLKPGGELKLETTICNEIRQHHNPVVINHVAEDAKFANHHTPLLYGFQSYISVPIRLKSGDYFGTLCAIDPKPNVINTPEILGMFDLFSDLIAFHLDAIEKVSLSDQNLFEERYIAELREHFIGVLGHDLRNPLNAILNSAQLLNHLSKDEKIQKIISIIQRSSHRMNGLIENMLDFASGRFGEGILLNKKENEAIETILVEVVAELEANFPQREINVLFDLQKPVNCDGKRIAQLFSNLLGNALSYGNVNAPINVKAISNDEGFELSVINTGKQISTAAMERLFQPFSRGNEDQNKKGLGLGLFIASEISKAHNGTISVSSTETETCFTLKIPV